MPPRKKKTIKKPIFGYVNYLDDYDLFYSSQINDCYNMINKKNIKYDCRKSPVENLKKLNFLECESIMIPTRKWKSSKKFYKHRANLLWNLSKC